MSRLFELQFVLLLATVEQHRGLELSVLHKPYRMCDSHSTRTPVHREEALPLAFISIRLASLRCPSG